MKRALKQFGYKLRVSMTAIVVSFDPVRQVVSVQPSVREVMLNNAVPTVETLPILDDVPIVLPMAGGMSLTLPIAPGDECDLVFNDMAFDEWWQSGGVQNQPDGVKFRHDIGDAKAHFGMRSQPRVLENYSTASMQLRTDDGLTVIDVAQGVLTLTAAQVSIVSAAIALGPSGGSAQGLVTKAWFDWFTTYVLPHITLPPGTPAPPTNAVTMAVQGD
jgi:hypothetical protein